MADLTSWAKTTQAVNTWPATLKEAMSLTATWPNWLPWTVTNTLIVNVAQSKW